MLFYSEALSQDRGRITGTQCILTTDLPTLTSLRPASGGTISWEKTTDPTFASGITTIGLAAGQQSYTDVALPVGDTYYRRVLTLSSGVDFLYSDTIRISVYASGSLPTKPTFNPVLGTETEICQQTTSFNVFYTTGGTPDKYSIIWSPAAITAGFEDDYNKTLGATPNSFSVRVPAAVSAGTFSGTLIAVNTTTGCTVSNASQIIVNALPVISVQPATTVQNICLSGTATDLSITAATPGGVITTTSVQWYSNVTNSNSGGTVVATHPAPPATDTYTPQTSVANALYYYAVVTNSKSCVTNSNPSGLITINAIPSAPAVSNNGPVCVGATLSLTTATLGGASYSWTGPNGFISTLQNPSIPTTSIGESGIYSLTVTVSGCTSAASSTTVTVKSTPSTPSAANGGAVCVGIPLQLTTATVSGATYAWTGPGGFNSSTQNPSVPTTSTAESGTYSLTVTVNGCTSAVSSTTATVNSIPSTPTATNGGAVCVGTPLQLTTATVGGATYAWTGPNGFVSSAQSPSVPTTSTAESGTYSLTITVNGCTSAVSSTTATVNSIPSTPTAANGGAVCAGAPLQLTTASVSGAAYTWTGPNGFVSSAQSPSVPTTSTAESGTYSLTITVNGCTSAVSSTTATVNGLPTVAITASGPTVFCAGGSVNLTASGGLSYNWSTGAGTSIISVVNSGSFTVTATDGNGCKGTSAATVVTVNALPTATMTASGPTVFCAGGSVNLTASGGLSYNWSTGAGTSIISVVNSGSFTVTATDGNGCKGTSAATLVTVNALPTATVSTSGPTSFCVGGSVSLTASAGAGYLWSTGATTQTISVTGSGTPSVRVTGANGCNATSAPVTVTVNPLPVATINNGNAVSFCAGGTTDLTASAGSSYLWSTGATARTISVGTAGARFVTVTDANGCSAVSAVTNVTVNPLPLATISAVGATSFCAGGSVSLTASAAATYLWSTGATSRTISMNTSGNPTVTVTDINGCSATSAPTAVTVNPLPNLIITHPAAVCAPGTVNLTAAAVTAGSTAGTVFTYFTDAATSTAFTSPTTTGVAGTYYIKGTLPSGCSSSRAVTVVINNPPSLTTQNPTAVCAPQTVNLTSPAITQGSDNGLVYTYFTDASLSATLLNPTAVGNSGVYYIKANAPGSACSAALPVTVTVHPIPTGNLQTPAVNYVCSGSTLPLTATDAFAYQWLLNQTPITGATNALYEASSAGIYSVRFISQEGCVREATNTLRVDQLVKPVLRLQLNSRCVALPVGFSNLSTYAGSGGINWLWDFGDGALANTFSPTHTYATAGNYTVSLMANNLSCPSLTETISIPVYVDSARVPVRYPTVKAVAGKAFPLTARSLGALYRWQPATGLNSTTVQSPMATLNNDIEYTVTITNSASCTTTDTVAVKLVFDGNIFVGNGFTPNGDGVNDRCYPILTGVRSLVYFKIYNRWGNLVFQTNDASPQNGWDGKYNGRLQPVGTYTWISAAVDGNGNIIKRNGNVLLIN
jgi:gliding motility-associated-like protein